jgi:hypothetical protein
MIENVRSLILLTTGRSESLVSWEVRNQVTYAGIEIISITNFSGTSSNDLEVLENTALLTSNSDDKCSKTIPSGSMKDSMKDDDSMKDSIKESVKSNMGNKKLNPVFLRAKFSCSDNEIDLLKSALANCILLRSVYEEEVAVAVGIDQMWKNISDIGLTSFVSGMLLSFTSTFG